RRDKPAPSRSKRWSKCGEKCCPATITPRAWPAAAVVSSENFVAQDQPKEREPRRPSLNGPESLVLA
ncbi:MAG: hypothetical protein NT154_45185, partial [Verrucomicrobia bacterium]|nr:hypothetical protein [Verrucomicrobiota bacterium]